MIFNFKRDGTMNLQNFKYDVKNTNAEYIDSHNMDVIHKIKKNQIIKNMVNWDKLYETLSKNKVIMMDYIGKGHRGIVFKGLMNNKLVAIKVPRIDGKNTVYYEGSVLMDINKLGIGPKVYHFSEDSLIMEYIGGGLSLKDYISQKNIKKEELLWIIEETLKQCIKLDLHKIDHTEIQGGKHIIISKVLGKVYIIDFDKSRKRKKPHNFTSAMSLFFGKCHIANRIKEILDVNDNGNFEDEIIKLVKSYKKIVLK